jgi:hypothetical protein
MALFDCLFVKKTQKKSKKQYEAFSGFLIAACDSTKCFENRLCGILKTVLKAGRTNERGGKLEQKFWCGFGNNF